MSWWQQDTPSGDTANLDRFLSFLKKAEGGEPDIIVGGGRFSDFSQHPRVVGLRTKEGPSTAAGNYQITASTYDDVAPKIGVTGFTPADQRAIAVELIRRKGALEDINGGDFTSAINKLGSTWASLPSSPYSQPKKSWDETNKMLGTQVASAKASENWWSKDTPVNDAGAQSNWWSGDTPVDAPAVVVGGPQPAPSPVVQAAPRVTSSVVPAPAANPAAAISTEQPLGERIKRGMSIGTRDVLEGIDKFNPVRAAFDFAGGVAGLAGATKARDYITNNLGMNAKQTLGSNIADSLGLAKPETKAEKTVSAGVQGASGLLTGTGLSNVISKAPQAAQAASSILLPAVSGTAKQVAGQAALTGGLSASMEVAPAETAAALAVLAAGKAGAGRYATSRGADKIIKNAGNPDAARLDAEIISDIVKTAKSGTQRGQPVTAVQLNAIEGKYINDVSAALKNAGSGKEVKAVKEALMNRRILTSDDLAPLRATSAGDAAADAILKAQRARSLTAATQSSGGLMPLLREGVDLLPLPAFAQRGLKAAMGGRQTREVVAQRLAKQGDAAEKVLERLGPSSATQSLQILRDKAAAAVPGKVKTASVVSSKTGKPTELEKTINKARAETQTLAEDAMAAKFSAPEDLVALAARAPKTGELPPNSPILSTIGKAQDETNALFNKGMDGSTALKNEIKNVTTEGKIAKGAERETLKVAQTQETKKVIEDFTGGKLAESMGEKAPGFTTMLKFVDTDAPTLTKALQDYAKQNPTRAQAAVDIMTLGGKANRQQFYRIQQDLQTTFGSKVAAEPGALSAATAANPVRNPISYQEAVRTAGEAADLARASAPTKELAQFATTVAGIKAPADKATAIAERLAKTSDPTEAAFLTQFVEPLAQFGKKTKK